MLVMWETPEPVAAGTLQSMVICPMDKSEIVSGLVRDPVRWFANGTRCHEGEMAEHAPRSRRAPAADSSHQGQRCADQEEHPPTAQGSELGSALQPKLDEADGAGLLALRLVQHARPVGRLLEAGIEEREAVSALVHQAERRAHVLCPLPPLRLDG